MGLPQIPRYKPGTDLLGFEDTPVGVTPELVILKAEDGAKSKGVLYSKGKEKTAICVIHPRGDMTRHYLIPYFVEAGFAAFGQESRWPNNDSNASHEILLGDVAAAMRFLKSRFEKVVFLGYSGGGSIYTLYQRQALTKPPGRIADTAAGDPYDLNHFDMPPADGIMYAGAHLGAGKMMQHELDPSVIDEKDGLSCDRTLDMYSPDNGFREPPEESRYSPEFLERYRAAQTARVERLDTLARGLIAEQRHFQSIAKSADFEKLTFPVRQDILRRAFFGQFMQIFRTDANPATLDLSLDPSSRSVGTINSVRPDLSNYWENGFARILTPRAWLSLWSGISSRAALLDHISAMTVPTAVVYFTGDNAIHPSIGKAIHASSPAADKQLYQVAGDHFGFHLPSHPNSGGREEAGRLLGTWLRDRFPH